MVLVYIFARYFELLCLVGVCLLLVARFGFCFGGVVWGGGFVCLVLGWWVGFYGGVWLF